MHEIPEARRMRTWPLLASCLCLGLSGCVSGYGGCLFVAPVKHTLNGSVHFKTYPGRDGVDNVPVLALDKMAYIYSPAQSFSCIATDELQLEGVSEFPRNVVEGSHVSVTGKVTAAVSSSQHTRFVMDVITLLPVGAPP